MTPDETRFFQLVDDYARTQHLCFLAEMTLRTEELGYWMCFRPLGGSEVILPVRLQVSDGANRTGKGCW